MQRKNAVLKTILIAIILPILLLILGGNVKANDEYWDTEGLNLFGLNNKEGKTFDGETNGIEWTCTITEKDPSKEGEIGKVSIQINNPEALPETLEFPDKIRFNGKLGATYVYGISEIKISVIEGETIKSATNLKEVILGKYVTTIGETAFLNCSSLEKVYFNESLSELAIGAFWGCEALTEIAIDENNSNFTYEDGVLFNKDKTELVAYLASKKDKEYTIPETVTKIAEGAFATNAYLEKVTIPNTVVEIGTASFASCSNLKEIKFSEDSPITAIPTNTFFSCVNLEKIELPKGITEIGDAVFYGCTNLKAVVLSNAVTTIAENAFNECNNNLVVYCYDCDGEFINNINANSTVIPAYILCEGVKNQDGELEYVRINRFIDVKGSCTEIKLLSNVYGLPIKELGEASFKGSNIEKIKIPTTVTTLGAEVFSECTKLNNLVLPASIEKIPSKAFYGSTSLTKIVIKKGSRISEIADDGFDGLVANIIVYHDGENDIITEYAAKYPEERSRIDNEAPTATIGSGTSFSGIEATIKLSDIKDNDGGSGAELYAISTSPTFEGVSENEWQEVTSETVTKTVTKNGTWYIYIVDMVGNYTTVQKEITGLDENAPIFDTEPTVEYSLNGAKITINVSDDKSGLAGYAITKSPDPENISDWKELSGLSSTIEDYITENDTWYLHVKDKGGNIATKEIIVNGIDNLPPKVGNIDIENNGKQAIATIEVFDDKSGIYAYAIELNESITDSTKWINIEENPLTYTINETIEANGTYYIHLKDKYGNTNAGQFLVEGLTDQIAPRVQFVEEENIIKVKITDAFSGINEGAKILYVLSDINDEAPDFTNAKELPLEYEKGDKEIISTVPFEGEGTYYIWIKIEELKDVAGYEYNGENPMCSEKNYIFDTKNPKITSATVDGSTEDKTVKAGTTVEIKITTSEEVSINSEATKTPSISNNANENLGTLGEMKQGQNKKEWFSEFVPGAGNGKAEIVIPKEYFVDNTGKTLEEDFIINNITLDNIAPTFTVTGPENPIINKEDVLEYILEYSEPVDMVSSGKLEPLNMNENDNTLENLGELSVVAADEEGKKWKVIVKNCTGDGKISLEFPTFVDLVGNGQTAIHLPIEITVDNTAPTYTITGPNDPIVNKDDTLEYILEYSEPVNIINETRGFATGNGDSTKYWEMKIEKADEEGKKCKVTVTNCTGDGVIGLTFPEFEDLAGNKAIYNQNKQFAITVDNTPIVNVDAKIKEQDEEKATVEIKIPEGENAQYLVSKDAEGITKDTEGWKDITTNPLNIEITEPGTYYVYVKDEAGNITRTDKIVIPVDMLVKPESLKVDLIEESKYAITEDKYIEKIVSNTTIQMVLDNISSNATTIEVYKGTEKVTDENKTIGTGMTIKFKKDTEEKTYIAVVKGDVTGDGLVIIDDIMRVNQHRIGTMELSNEKKKAADIIEDGKVEINDIMEINKIRLKSNH